MARRSYFVTDREAELFVQQAPDSAAVVEAMANGVDADFFAPDPRRASPYPAGQVAIVFTGADGNFNLGRVSDLKLDNTIDAIKIATDVKARDALLKEALVKTRDEHYYVPLHHQLRPWAMKKSVTTVHSADDRPQARFATVK